MSCDIHNVDEYANEHDISYAETLICVATSLGKSAYYGFVNACNYPADVKT
jgi:hypothetical protein